MKKRIVKIMIKGGRRGERKKINIVRARIRRNVGVSEEEKKVYIIFKTKQVISNTGKEKERERERDKKKTK